MVEFKTDNFIGRKIRLANVGLLLVGLVLLLIAVLLTLLVVRPLYNQVAGPRTFSAETLLSISEPQKQFHYRARIENPKYSLIVIGPEPYKTSREVYQLIVIKDRLLVVRARADRLNLSPVTGALTRLTDMERQEISTSVQELNSGKQPQTLLPIMLDTMDDKDSPAWLLLAVFAILYYLSITNIRTAILRLSDISKNIAYKQLCQYGDPVKIAAEIEMEVKDKNSVERIGSALITRNWLINFTDFNVELAKLKDLEYFCSRVHHLHSMRHQETVLDFFGKNRIFVTRYRDAKKLERVLSERAPQAERLSDS